MKNITAGILPLAGAVVVFGVSLFDSSLTRETALIVLVLLSLHSFLFNKSV